MDTIHVLGIAGSLRARSLNHALLTAAQARAPGDVQLEVASLRGVPLFDQDREAVDAGGPDLAALRDAVDRADALLIATPEYNQSIPGVLKNAIDWLSRPAPNRVLEGKAVAVVGATTGPWGTRYAQQVLRHTLTSTGCVVMGSPMLFVANAAAAFDDDGTLVDASLAERLQDVVAHLATWTRTVGTPQLVH